MYASRYDYEKLSEKVDEFFISLAEAKADVRLSLDKHDEVKLILKENFTNLEKSLIKTRHECRNLIFSLENRVRKLEDDGKYDQGVKDTNEKISHARDVRVDNLSKRVGIAVGFFSVAIGILGWLHIENLKLLNHVF